MRPADQLFYALPLPLRGASLPFCLFGKSTLSRGGLGAELSSSVGLAALGRGGGGSTSDNPSERPMGCFKWRLWNERWDGWSTFLGSHIS